MGKLYVRRGLGQRILVSVAAGALALAIVPRDATAEFQVPDCGALKELGLDYFNHYNDKRLTEVFGASMFTWRNAEIKQFVKGFQNCKSHFSMHQQFNFDVSVSMAANDIVRRINQHHKKQAKLRAGIKISPKVEALLQKYSNLAPEREFLAMPFRTYAGATSTGDVASVIEFYDQIDGDKTWEKVRSAWVLVVDGVNAATGQSSNTRMVFLDQRPKKLHVWLDSVTIDGNTLEPQVVTYMVRQMFAN